jgi:large subunit ribosomal protein LP2
VGVEADADSVSRLLKELEGKDLAELVAAGREKLQSVPSGAAAAAAPAAGGAAPAAKKEEAKKEEPSEEDEVSGWVLWGICFVAGQGWVVGAYAGGTLRALQND